jgi:hypothetical protein
MEMFLMVACMALLGSAVCAIAFGAAARDARPALEPEMRKTVAKELGAVPERFFAQDASQPTAPPAQPVPIELLLARIERHVRLEQAAAESFVDYPSAESLHSRTTSPLLN